ncbi:MAG: hypothetical protein NTY80_04930 [candidate division SR1 bacterium]|nr:hypothetical protein [candidate division SR1 bacterium]
MTKAQQTADQYNTIRLELVKKGSVFGEEAKNKKKLVLEALSGVEEAGKSKETSHKAKVTLTKKFREENKNLIAEHKKLGTEHRKNEAVFQELFAKAKEGGFTDLDEETFKNAISGDRESLSGLENRLLKKENMDAIDKANMKKTLDDLKRNDMLTLENLQKLDNNLSYTPTERIINGVYFSRTKFVPDTKFNDKPNSYGVFECESRGILKGKEKGIYKAMYNGNPEYYLSTDKYIEQAEKQGKKAIKDSDIRKALQGMPGDFSDNTRYIGGNILGNILGLSMSGCVDSDGQLYYGDGYGSLSSASPVHSYNTRAFTFNEDKGKLYNSYSRYDARPCLFLTK